MHVYTYPEGFWPEFLLLMGGLIVLVGVFPPFVRRWMKADKKEWFSYNHINDFHKKGDWTIRIAALISLLGCAIFFLN